MKRKVLITLSIFTIFFLIGGIYLILSIERSTEKLDTLITLHQVEMLRENLLMQIKRVQSDLRLKGTRFESDLETVIINVNNMESMVVSCFGCHHKPEIYSRLNDLKEDITEYKRSISKLFTISANEERVIREEDRTFRIGERLLANVNSMISIASNKLEEMTRVSVKEISKTKNILFFIIALGPLSISVFALFFIRGFTKPLAILQYATKKIKEGYLDFKIEKLEDEFEVLANSFNDMTRSVSDSMLKVKESEKKYRMLFESAGDAIFVLEARGENAGRIISANQAAADMHGYTMDELMQLNIIRDLDTLHTAEYAPERLHRIINGEWISFEGSHRKKDGSVFPVEISAGLVEFMGDEYILAFDKDITKRKKAESELRESESRFKAIFDNANDGILLIDERTRDVYTGNRKMCEMLGYAPGELEGINMSSIHNTAHSGDFGESGMDVLNRLVTGDITSAGNIPVIRKDGSLFYADISASSINFEDRRYLLGFYRDITKRKEAETLLIQSKIDWEDTFNTITDMITIHDKDFNIIRSNKAATEILGLPFLNSRYSHSHGENDPTEDSPGYAAYMTKQPVSYDMYEPNLSKFLEIRVLPRIDQNNEITGVIHVVRDITEEKRVQQELQRAEQLKAVGVWAAGLAHEIKNPLAGIKISVEILSEDMKASEDNMFIVTSLLEEIKRIEMLIRNLLDFAKPSEPEPEDIDINTLLDKSIAFSLRHPRKKAESIEEINIVKDFSSVVPHIVADPHHMRQVFLNLLLNAIDAMGGKGTLKIRTSYIQVSDMVQIIISDTGKGIDSRNIESIFEPFYTTKSKGTGLGLAITKRLIEQHGGTIGVESKLNHGTAFTIHFPAKKTGERHEKK